MSEGQKNWTRKSTQIQVVTLFLMHLKCVFIKMQIHTVAITPPWPAKSFNISCPDTLQKCKYFQTEVCFEPEVDTFEVLTSLLMNCDTSCHYVDIGCNMGIFAQHALHLGASVTCIEPQSVYKSVLSEASQKYSRFHFDFAAISLHRDTSTRHFKGYRPCGIGHGDPIIAAPFLELSKVIENKYITLLKIDIDAFEGAILSQVLQYIQNNKTKIDSIVVELGDGKYVTKGPQQKLNQRGGNMHDLWYFQNMSYDVYRLNIHVMNEIFDKYGNNVNKRIVPLTSDYHPVHFLRNIRRAEILKRHDSYQKYDKIANWAQSFLITKVNLLQHLPHHSIDITAAHLKFEDLKKNYDPL